jgi:hypothetical protein
MACKLVTIKDIRLDLKQMHTFYSSPWDRGPPWPHFLCTMRTRLRTWAVLIRSRVHFNAGDFNA